MPRSEGGCRGGCDHHGVELPGDRRQSRRFEEFGPSRSLRFLLLRRPDRLDDAERARLDGLFEAHPRLRAACDALGELHGLYLADDEAGALAALDRFTDLCQTGDLPAPPPGASSELVCVNPDSGGPQPHHRGPSARSLPKSRQCEQFANG